MTTGRIEMGPTGRTIASNIRRIREARGLSLRTLSVELRKAGRTLSADALNKIENGRASVGDDDTAKQVRRVDSDDLMALAVALRVSPLTLLLPWPTHEDSEVEITGAGVMTARQGWDWALGHQPPALSDADPVGDLQRFPLDALPPWARPLINVISLDATDEQWAKLAAAGYAHIDDEYRGKTRHVGGGMAELLENAPQEIANAERELAKPDLSEERHADLQSFIATKKEELEELREARARGEEL